MVRSIPAREGVWFILAKQESGGVGLVEVVDFIQSILGLGNGHRVTVEPIANVRILRQKVARRQLHGMVLLQQHDNSAGESFTWHVSNHDYAHRQRED